MMIHLMPFSQSNFQRYNSQSEFTRDESNDLYDSTQKPTTNSIPPLMSLTITSPIMTTNTQQKSTIPDSVIKENIEPLPYPSHAPGPIQRPTKLSYTLNPFVSSLMTDSPQSPSTPDVLVQINHLLDHQNSITIPSTPNVANVPNPSTMVNDLSTPSGSWTPFSSTEWSSKFDSSWSLTSPNVPITTTTRMPNPFALKQGASVWPSAMGTPPSDSASAKPRTERTAEWSDMFPAAVPPSTETEKTDNNTWLNFLATSEPARVDDTTSNKQENEPNTPFWNSISIQETSVNPTTTWWTKAPSNENNNNNNNNSNNNQSRWDFAR